MLHANGYNMLTHFVHIQFLLKILLPNIRELGLSLHAQTSIKKKKNENTSNSNRNSWFACDVTGVVAAPKL